MVLCGIVFSLARAAAAESAFTYQGRLSDGGAAANGIYDFRFTTYDAPNGGNLVSGGSVAIPGIGVSNGLFTAVLDFGVNVFNGAARFLEIAVRTNGSAGSYTPLTPLQQITAAPYAVNAVTAGNATQLNGQPPGYFLAASNFTGTVSDARLSTNVARLNANQTFGGTNTFNKPVVISSAAPAFRMYGPGGMGSKTTLDLSTYDPGTNAPAARLLLTDNNWGSDWDFYSKQQGANNNPLVSRLHISGNGDVGIGTDAPTEKLDVRGNIKLGSTGQYFAAGGQENLRIIRGIIQVQGTNASPYNGSGYTVTRHSVGNYTINFSSFPDIPAVNITLVEGGSSKFAVLDLMGLNSATFSIHNADGNLVDAL